MQCECLCQNINKLVLFSSDAHTDPVSTDSMTALWLGSKDREGTGGRDEIFRIISHSDHTKNGRKPHPHVKLDSSQHSKSCILGKKFYLQTLPFP